MEIIPAIYIRDGKCVALYKGETGQMDTYSISPLNAARNFQRDGAEKLYLADLDGINAKAMAQADLLREIINELEIPVIVEAGSNTVEDARAVLEMGALQVVVRSPSYDFVIELLQSIEPEKLIVQLYSKDSELIEERKKTRPDDFTDVVDYAEKLVPLGVKYVVYKDRRSEGTLIHPNYDEIDRLFLTTGRDLKIYSSGGISDPKHLKLLKKIGATGAIIGKGFFEHKITVREAMNA